tara:strand:+ start:9184 stop:9429 length:246 start_codon:yes stop_codon:yes gene_type:complete
MLHLLDVATLAPELVALTGAAPGAAESLHTVATALGPLDGPPLRLWGVCGDLWRLPRHILGKVGAGRAIGHRDPDACANRV